MKRLPVLFLAVCCLTQCHPLYNQERMQDFCLQYQAMPSNAAPERQRALAAQGDKIFQDWGAGKQIAKQSSAYVPFLEAYIPLKSRVNQDTTAAKKELARVDLDAYTRMVKNGPQAENAATPPAAPAKAAADMEKREPTPRRRGLFNQRQPQPEIVRKEAGAEAGATAAAQPTTRPATKPEQTQPAAQPTTRPAPKSAPKSAPTPKPLEIRTDNNGQKVIYINGSWEPCN